MTIHCHKSKTTRKELWTNLTFWPWTFGLDFLTLTFWPLKTNIFVIRICNIPVYQFHFTVHLGELPPTPPPFSTMIESLYNLKMKWITLKFIISYWYHTQQSVTNVCHNFYKVFHSDCFVDPDHVLDHASK